MRNNRNALGNHSKNPLGIYKRKNDSAPAAKKISAEEFKKFAGNLQTEMRQHRKKQFIIFTIMVFVLTIFTIIAISMI